MGANLEWMLVYTKARCEAWADANLRNQGFSVLFPRVQARAGFAPLFPRYLFVGHGVEQDTRSVRNTRGVQRLVQFSEHPVRVPEDVIEEIRGRMDLRGVVELETDAPPRPLFDHRERARLRALVKFAAAGFRVRAA